MHHLDALVAMTISFSDQSEEPVKHVAVYSSNLTYRQEVGVMVSGVRIRIRFKIGIVNKINI